MTDTPWEPPLAGTELEHLVGVLDRLRMTFRWKADDLDAVGLGTRIGASALTLGGLLKHMAINEDFVFTRKLTGEPVGEPWESLWDGTDDWEFTSAADTRRNSCTGSGRPRSNGLGRGWMRPCSKAGSTNLSTSPRPRESMRACADCCAI